MSSSRAKSLGAVAALLLLPTEACEFVTDTEFATLTIQLTDAADPQVTEAWVTITDIYLQPGPGDTDPPGGRVYVLEDAEETHELLSLKDNVAFLTVGVDIPAGTYEQLRLVISDGCIVVESDGESAVYRSSPNYTECDHPPPFGTLQMPSYGQSGLKIELHGLELSGDQGILLDFDVSESYGHQAGNSGRWVMHPVIHWMEADLTARIDVSLSAGGVDLSEFNVGLEAFKVTISWDGVVREDVNFEDDGEGNFVVSFGPLNPNDGPFDLELKAPLGLGMTLTCGPGCEIMTVDPGSGEAAKVEWVLQSVFGVGT